MDITCGPSDGQKDDLSIAPLTIRLQVRGNFYPIVIGQREFDLYLAQVARLHVVKVEAAHIVFEQDAFFVAGKQPPPLLETALAPWQKTNIASP